MTTQTSEVKQPVALEQDTKQSRQRRNRMLAILGAGLLLLVIVIGAFVYAMITWTTSITSPASATADQYYAAIKNQESTKAYSYLDTKFTFNGVLISEESYNQAATRLDMTAGKVVDYSISNVTTSWNFGQNIASATVHVTRAHQSYDVHLTMKLQGSTYKITSFDSI